MNTSTATRRPFCDIVRNPDTASDEELRRFHESPSHYIASIAYAEGKNWPWKCATPLEPLHTCTLLRMYAGNLLTIRDATRRGNTVTAASFARLNAAIKAELPPFARWED